MDFLQKNSLRAVMPLSAKLLKADHYLTTTFNIV